MNMLAAIAMAEATAGRCDRCHVAAGVDFLDGFWACAGCAHAYLQGLEAERQPPEPRWVPIEGKWWRRRND